MQKISTKTKRNSLIIAGIITIFTMLFFESPDIKSFEKYLGIIFLVDVIIGIFILYIYMYVYKNVYHGAYGVTSSSKNMDTVVEFLKKYKPSNILDLGSGTGSMCIKIKKEGFNISGIEINPIYFFISKLLIRINRLSHKIKIKKGDMWKLNLAEYDCVIIYGISFIMDELEQKLLKEMKKGSYVISIYFKFKNIEVLGSKDEVTLYKI